jgi:hypothetical protein
MIENEKIERFIGQTDLLLSLIWCCGVPVLWLFCDVQIENVWG